MKGTTCFPERSYSSRKVHTAIDLVVSTLSLKHLEGKPFVQIGPIQSAKDSRKLQQAFNELQHRKMIQNLSQLLYSVTDEKRFYHVSGGFSSQDAALDYLIEPLHREGLVPEDFRDAILRREALSNTRIGSVALPQAIGTPAKKDTLSFLVSDVPIPWGRKEVWAVLLFTTASGHYQSACLKVLRRLSHVLERKETLQKLLKCHCWQDFIDLMLKKWESPPRLSTGAGIPV